MENQNDSSQEQTIYNSKNFRKSGCLDRELHTLLYEEYIRQSNTISLVASENIASGQIRYINSSILTNKYAEGYPGKRYYGGCEVADKIESLCQQRACELFGATYANVQPHSGSQANLAVFNALLQPGDTILGMSLPSGGHLSHGSKVNISGKMYNSVSYGLNQDELIDMDEVRQLALTHKPKLIIAGTSAYSKTVDWEAFQQIAKEVGAFFLADMAHVSGLIAAKRYPNPMPFADVVTSTTHKTLKGPRGGIILTNNLELSKLINKSVFPGVQGGPLMHTIASKAMCFYDAQSSEFVDYINDVIQNSKVMCEELQKHFKIVSSDTDTHLFIMKLDDCSGQEAEQWLANAGIIVNKNMIPNDTKGAKLTSGIRIGTPWCTSRGFGAEECKMLAKYITEIITTRGAKSADIKIEINKLCDKFPLE